MNLDVIIKEDLPFIRITLNRPQRGNAYDHSLAKSLIDNFEQIEKRDDLHAVILEGNGSHFCTGADLEWMAKARTLSSEDNVKDMGIIKKLYQKVLTLPIPLVVIAKGKVRGGGVGLVAAGDIVIASRDSTFSLSESRLGLIPGIITPIVESKVGRSHFLELALTAREFSSEEAWRLGLVHHLESPANLEQRLMEILINLKDNSRSSLVEIKKNLVPIYQEELFESNLKRTANLRSNAEFKERFEKIWKLRNH